MLAGRSAFFSKKKLDATLLLLLLLLTTLCSGGIVPTVVSSTTTTYNNNNNKTRINTLLPHKYIDDSSVSYMFEEHRLDSDQYTYGRETKMWMKNKKQVYAHDIAKKPVYISMTTISTRIDKMIYVVKSHFKTTVIPTRLFVFISREPKFIDKGVALEAFRNITKRLTGYPVSVVYTDNIGPHRKMIPLLWSKWNEDCLLATFDDDSTETTNKHRLYQLLKYFLAADQKAVSSLRPRRINFCTNLPHKVRQYASWPIIINTGRVELMMLPTGTGGVMYHPKFFHPCIFDKKLRQLTEVADDVHLRFAVMAKGVPVVVACSHDYSKGGCPAVARVVINETYTKLLKDSDIVDIQKYGVRTDNGYKDSEGTRRLNIPKNLQNQQSLYGINRHYNDKQIRDALAYLSKVKIMNIESLAAEVIFGNKGDVSTSEREDSCFNLAPAVPVMVNSSLHHAKKPKIPLMCAIEMCSHKTKSGMNKGKN